MTEFVSAEVECSLIIGGMDYLTTDLNSKITNFNEVDLVEATVLPKGHLFEPAEGNTATVYLGGEKIYTGFVGDSKDNSNGSYDIKLYNAIHRLKTARVDISVDSLTPASDLLENHVFPQAGIEDYNVDFASPVESRLARKLSNASGNDLQFESCVDSPLVMDRTNAPGDKVMEDICSLVNATWWCDEDGILQVGKPENIYVDDVTFVTDWSKGKATPAYASVKVVGDNVVSAEGWEGRNMVSKETAKAVRSIDNYAQAAGVSEAEHSKARMDFGVEKGLLKEPTYVHKSKDIKTSKQAEAVANRLITKLIRQAGQGDITVVGRSDIAVNQGIRLPEEMSGTEYLVEGIEHRVSNSGGWVTKIHLAGTISS